MKFDVYVFNNPHNAWTYTRGYIEGFQQYGCLNQAGDITSWHDQKQWAALFDTKADCIVLIGVEHHRYNIWPDAATIERFKLQKKGKKVIGIFYESMSDPFGQNSWAKNGQRWLADNYRKYGSRSSQCYNVTFANNQFACLDYLFTQDEVDEALFKQWGLNAHWLPACADTTMFRPVSRGIMSAAFVGAVWWPRDELVRHYPFAFAILNAPKAGFHEANAPEVVNGLVSTYCAHGIGVNMRSPFAGVSMRTFELMACGVFPVVYAPAPDRVKNRAVFGQNFPHIVWFNELSDESRKLLGEHYNHVICHPQETWDRGMECRRVICEAHTPKHRVDTIIKAL